MMLEQIQKRLALFQKQHAAGGPSSVRKLKKATKKEIPMQTQTNSKPGRATEEAKTVGVKVEPDLYAALRDLQTRRGLPSIKEALLTACREGIKQLNARDSSTGAPRSR